MLCDGIMSGGGEEGGCSVEKDDLDSGRGEWWTTTGRWGGGIYRELER